MNDTMPTNTVNTGDSGNGAVTALLAILVIAIIAFGLWYFMGHRGATENTPATGGGIQVTVGGGTQAPAPNNQ